MRPSSSPIAPRRPARTPLATAALLLALAAPFGARDAAHADSDVIDAALGDEFEGEVDPGDVDTYRANLTKGTRVQAEARADADEDSPVTLVLRGPTGSELARKSGLRARIEFTIAASGVHVFEVTAAAETDYEFRVEGEAGSGGGGAPVVPPGGDATVHLDVARGAFVKIEARRVTGSPPRIVAVRDAFGRDLDVNVRRQTSNRVELHPVPVSGPGGLDVVVAAADGGAGTYSVRAETTDTPDDGPGGDHEERESRKIVLSLAPGADPAAVVAALGPGYELEDVGEGYIVVETPEGREGFESEDAIDADVRLEEVVSAEANAFLDAPEGSQTNGVVVGSDLGRSDFDRQAALGQLRADLAHARATGAGIVVAVLDTGCDATHPLLAGRVLTADAHDAVDRDADASEETNGLDDDGDLLVDEGYGHGTFVAGLVLGAAPDAKILPLRVLDTDARGTVARITSGIHWALDHGADVINLSIEMPVRSGVLADAVRLALGRGVVVVAAAGNGGLATGPSFPAAVNGVLAVTATDGAGRPTTFGNGGPGTVVAAPGVDVLGPVPGGEYGTWSGTSFSSGLAAGAAALVLERTPAARPPQVLQRIARGARPAPRGVPAAKRRLLGSGRLDLSRTLR